jgi:hypothetical protein
LREKNVAIIEPTSNKVLGSSVEVEKKEKILSKRSL